MLSIIIISKNEEKVLPRLLISIKNQNFKEYELILSDANSTDKTREIAKRFGCKIVEGGLPAKGRNNGAKESNGNILLFLDSDIALPRDFLKKGLKEFYKRKLSIAGATYIPISDRSTDKILHLIYNSFSRIMQFISPHAGGCCIFVKKEIFDKMKGFNEQIKIAEDHDFVKRSVKYGKFRILRSRKIYLDVRRLNKEGRLNLIRKFLLISSHRIFKGEIKKANFDYDMQGINIKDINN